MTQPPRIEEIRHKAAFFIAAPPEVRLQFKICPMTFRHSSGGGN
jgi:hypothetical protein